MAGVKGRSGGRNRKPSWLKVINGSAAHNAARVNRDEPAVDVNIPSAPDWLSGRARKLFARLGEQAATLRVIADTDAEALALAAHAADEFLAADELVTESGLVLSRTDSVGNQVLYKNPAVTVRESAWRRFSIAIRAFGLDPQSRATVKALKPRANTFTQFRQPPEDRER